MHDAFITITLTLSAFTAILMSKVISYATIDAPVWVTTASGPLSVAGVMAIAVVWLTRRMEKAESREVVRQASNDILMEKMIAANVRVADALTRNSDILVKVDRRLELQQNNEH